MSGVVGGITEEQDRGRQDRPVLRLVLCNMAVMVWAIAAKWSLVDMMWVYWAQSMCIGFWGVVNMLSLKDYSTEDFFLGEFNLRPNIFTKLLTLFVFVVLFGFWHLVYAAVLGKYTTNAGRAFVLVVGAGGVFFFNQFYSFVFKKVRYYKGDKPNIGDVFCFPLYRLWPMHFTMIGAAVVWAATGLEFIERAAIVIFVLLKTLVDAATYSTLYKSRQDD